MLPTQTVEGIGRVIDITSSEAGHSLWSSTVSFNTEDVFFKIVKNLITNVNQSCTSQEHRAQLSKGKHERRLSKEQVLSIDKTVIKSRNKFVSPKSICTVSRGRGKPQALKYCCATSASSDSEGIAATKKIRTGHQLLEPEM